MKYNVDHVHAHIRINFRKTTPLRYQAPLLDERVPGDKSELK